MIAICSAFRPRCCSRASLYRLLSGFFHPDQVPANDHAAVFADYAASHVWIAVHLGQFIGMAGIIAGLIALPHALDAKTSKSGRLGAVAAIVALSLYGVLQAVDGVALKHAVDSWMSAPEVEKPARFASAETIRWLEWAVRSYQSYMLGIALILMGAMIIRTHKITNIRRLSDGGFGACVSCAGLDHRLGRILTNEFNTYTAWNCLRSGLEHLAAGRRVAARRNQSLSN